MPKYMHSLKRPPLVLRIVLLQNIAALRLRLLRENWPFRKVRFDSGALGHRSNVRVPGRWLLPSSLPTIFSGRLQAYNLASTRQCSTLSRVQICWKFDGQWSSDYRGFMIKVECIPSFRLYGMLHI